MFLIGMFPMDNSMERIDEPADAMCRHRLLV